MSKFSLKLLFSAVLIFTFTVFAAAQETSAALDLGIVLTKADEQTKNYQEEFKNLLSEETKTFEEYKKDGKVKDRSVVESNFIVYQSLKDANRATEFRNVVRVDGKAVGDSEKRATGFFERLANSASIANELQEVQKESSRYDKTLEISGLTLLQAPILDANLRPYFDYKLVGQEQIEGNYVYVIEYRQTKKSPFVLLNQAANSTDALSLNFEADLPGALKDATALLRGRLWIDTNTFQVWREERELTAQPREITETVVLNKGEFEYQKSDFGILVPKRISLSDFAVKKKDKRFDSFLETKVSFEYRKFSKSNVEVNSGEVKS